MTSIDNSICHRFISIFTKF